MFSGIQNSSIREYNKRKVLDELYSKTPTYSVESRQVVRAKARELRKQELRWQKKVARLNKNKHANI